MFTLIIIIAGLIFAVGALKSMTPEERSTTIKYTFNLLTLGVVYLFRGLKSGAQVSYHAGRYSGAKLATEGQDTIDHMDTVNYETELAGGATKIAIRKSQDHANTLGLSGIVNEMKTKADAEVEIANAKREDRLARQAARKAKYNI